MTTISQMSENGVKSLNTGYSRYLSQGNGIVNGQPGVKFQNELAAKTKFKIT